MIETKSELVAGYQEEGTSKEGKKEIGNAADGNKSHEEEPRKEQSCFVMGSDAEEGDNLLSILKFNI